MNILIGFLFLIILAMIIFKQEILEFFRKRTSIGDSKKDTENEGQEKNDPVG